MRSYTIRAHDPAAGTVDIDFYLHGTDGRARHGPATRWARAARPGDTLGMFGPSADFATPIPLGASDWTLLAADGCSLAALATVVEALPPGHRAVAFVQVADATEEQTLVTDGELSVHWLHGETSGAEAMADAVRRVTLPSGKPYAWPAGEAGAVRALRRPAGAVRALRRHLIEERGYDRRAVGFTGYWRHRLPQGDAPTPEDLAEARERLKAAGGRRQAAGGRRQAAGGDGGGGGGGAA
ncbi:siderophore-interacting protein [Streptomyces sp. NPDC046332]|uniref:siderophore-interacting protein n=1 Tax=Streptomyces sp. NPDC046332 TaxID=3155133 RepID=UPI0033CB8669